MRRFRTGSAGALLAVLLVLTAVAPATAFDTDAKAEGDDVDSTATKAGPADDGTSGGGAGHAPSPVLRQTKRIPTSMCDLLEEATTVVCSTDSDGGIATADCEPGQTPLAPLFERTRPHESAAWSDWNMIEGPSCSGTPDLAPLVEKEFKRPKIQAATVHKQPNIDNVLINVPVIVYADAPKQTFDITLLDTPVRLEVSPTSYTWNFGDGSAPLVTTSPGHPYPKQDVTHTYTAPQQATITLTTTWQGRFSVDGGEWQDVNGENTTVSPTVPTRAVEARSQLVEDPLDD